jgi:hypothetical protein
MRKNGMRLAWLCLGAFVAMCASGTAWAQAWIDDKGTGSVGLHYGYQFSDGTLQHSTTTRQPVIITGVPAQRQTLVLEAEYVPLEHLAIGAAMELSATRYTGPQTSPDPTILIAHGSYDDGDYHVTPTDLTLSARYAVLARSGVGLSVFTNGLLPVRKYEARGYGAAGQHLKRLELGVAVGTNGLVLNNGFTEVSASYSIVEREKGGGSETSKYNLNQVKTHLMLGYFFSETWAAFARFDYLLTQGGFDLVDYFTAPASVQTWHDSILNASAFIPSLGGLHDFSEHLHVTAAFSIVALGDNVSNAKLLTTTVAWSW